MTLPQVPNKLGRTGILSLFNDWAVKVTIKSKNQSIELSYLILDGEIDVLVILRLFKTYVAGDEILQLGVHDWMKLLEMTPYVRHPTLRLYSRWQQCHVGWCVSIDSVMLIVFPNILLGG